MSLFITELKCVSCNKSYPPEPFMMTCPACGALDGILDYKYDIEGISRAWDGDELKSRGYNHWRYWELLPLENFENISTRWSVGWTPIINAVRFADEIGVKQLLLKDEGRNPTASFKDRASSVGVVHAIEIGADVIACSSTGNAATSLAGHCALAGVSAVIFVPDSAPVPKLAQLQAYGAKIFAVQGSYDDAYNLCNQACKRFGWYNRNCAINPVLIEGKKTAGMEIGEQTAADFGGVPDWVVVSVGDGCSIAGVWKGLVHMYEIGVISKLPRLLGVQAENVAPVAYAMEQGSLPVANDNDNDDNQNTTLADSINVAVPRNWRKAVLALRESNGVMITVSDDSILAAIAATGKHGIFAEPAAAAAVAGLCKAVEDGIISGNDTVLALITGSGLKDTQAALRACSSNKPIIIEPTLEAITEIINPGI